MIRYLITDGSAARDGGGWVRRVEFWLGRVDFVQIREPELTARELAKLVTEICSRGASARILVNDRADVALAAGADGVHLRDGSAPPRDIRKIAARRLLISVACHDTGGVLRAAAEEADCVLLGPVFAPLSKPATRKPLGLEKLRNAAWSVPIPVIALGGIREDNAAACARAGAAGVAGITLFSKTVQ